MVQQSFFLYSVFALHISCCAGFLSQKFHTESIMLLYTLGLIDCGCKR